MTETDDVPAHIQVLTDEAAVIVELTVGDTTMGVTYENAADVKTLARMLLLAADEVVQ